MKLATAAVYLASALAASAAVAAPPKQKQQQQEQHDKELSEAFRAGQLDALVNTADELTVRDVDDEHTAQASDIYDAEEINAALVESLKQLVTRGVDDEHANRTADAGDLDALIASLEEFADLGLVDDDDSSSDDKAFGITAGELDAVIESLKELAADGFDEVEEFDGNDAVLVGSSSPHQDLAPRHVDDTTGVADGNEPRGVAEAKEMAEVQLFSTQTMYDEPTQTLHPERRRVLQTDSPHKLDWASAEAFRHGACKEWCELFPETWRCSLGVYPPQCYGQGVPVKEGCCGLAKESHD